MRSLQCQMQVSSQDYDGKFDPNGEMTRAQLAKVLVEAFNLKGSTAASFKDVPKDHWAHEYINILYHNEDYNWLWRW